MRRNETCLACALALGVTLSGCGGGGGGKISVNTGGGEAEASFGLLKPAASDQEMAASLQRGLADSRYISSAVDFISAPGDEVDFSPAPGGDNFSTTTLQEAGVDEADIVKYDGDILYLLDYSEAFAADSAEADFAGISFAPESFTGTIRLLRSNIDTPAIREIARIEFETANLDGGLYLAGEGDARQLIRVGQDGAIYNWGLFALDAHWQDQSTEIQAWNIGTPETPTESWALAIEGSLLVSRRIDNMLYLVTRHAPVVDGLLPFPTTDEDVAANRALLDSTPLTDLLPDISRDGEPPQDLVTATDCYVPNEEYEDLAPTPASGSLITVTAIDLEAPANMQSTCLNTFASGYYASRNSLYLTASNSGGSTYIHKISLAGGWPEYRGSGEVPGYLGTHNPSFLMSESGADLRVVSSTWDDGFPLPVADIEPGPEEEPSAAEQEEEKPDLGRHFLTILRENPDEARLEQIASLPNRERPAHIGKPGEDLYAARFMDDRAYLVTFETIDPLYVLDLASARDPRIAGELELPGFSTMLQPLGEDLLLGIGSEVAVDRPIPEGVKIALFNVGDITRPVELASEVIGERGTHSPALHDHHALTLLETGGIYRTALPVSRYIGAPGPFGIEPQWANDALYKLEVDPIAGSLTLVGSLISEERSPGRNFPQHNLYGSRSVLHDNAVFFVQSPRVLTGRWGD